MNNHNIFDINTFKYIYTCEQCGCKFVTKFQNYNLCSNCLKHILKEIHEKLIKNPDYLKLFN